jgi:hypothetical protein
MLKNLIIKLRFDIKPEYLKMLTFDVENYLGFFSIKHARKRKARTVEAVDVRRVGLNAILANSNNEPFLKYVLFFRISFPKLMQLALTCDRF